MRCSLVLCTMKHEKRVLLILFLVLSGYVIYTAAGYPSVPGTLGPAFFPMLSAGLLGVLSLAELAVSLLEKADAAPGAAKSHDLRKISLVLGMLLAATLVMQFVNPWLGIFAFFCAYVHYIAKERWRNTAVIAILGTAVIYLLALLLHIRL